MDLITRESPLITPRQAILEMYEMRGGVARCPKWFERRLDRVGNWLANCDTPLLDEPMNASSIDATLQMAWRAVSSPEYRQRELEQEIHNAQRPLH